MVIVYILYYIFIYLYSPRFSHIRVCIRINFYFCYHRVGAHLAITVVTVNGAFELERLKFSKLNVSKRFLLLLLLLPMVKCFEIAEMLLSTLYNRIYCLKQRTYDANIKHPLSWNKGKGTYF